MPGLPGELTFELGEGKDGVPASLLVAQLRGFLRALVQLDIQMSEDQRQTTRWVVVKASYNSPLTMTLASRPRRGRVANPDVTREFVRGVKALTQNSEEPANFTPGIMQTTKKLIEKAQKGGASLTIFDPDGVKVKPGVRAVKNINKLLIRKGYNEYTSIEGTLGTINVHNKLEFIVYDLLTDRGTTCKFSRERYDEARNALGERVAITGMATFNREDQPTTIDVEGIHVFVRQVDLPKFSTGEEINISGCLDSVEFIRRGRDAE